MVGMFLSPQPTEHPDRQADSGNVRPGLENSQPVFERSLREEFNDKNYLYGHQSRMISQIPIPYGQIALLGSGETSLTGGRIFESIVLKLSAPVRIAILETPAGFELNSPQVAGRVGDYLKLRLQNYHPVVDVVPARKRGTGYSPDDHEVLKPLLEANIIFMGPGSPTYAIRQLRGSLAWDLIRARHRQGAALIFASAATIAIGEHALPVYEIFKVGEDVRRVDGLGMFSDFGLSLSCIPHWNNCDGGADVDTSRCFIGMERFREWCGMLPPESTTIGLDEHTGLIIDFSDEMCTVNGISSVTVLRNSQPVIHPAGSTFPIAELGNFQCTDKPDTGIPTGVWELFKKQIRFPSGDENERIVPDEVQRLAEQRQQARLRKDWMTADLLRVKMGIFGWNVQDTEEGQKIVKQS
jgi:hypothetical protein